MSVSSRSSRGFRLEVVRPSDVGPADRAAWEQICAGDPRLAGPFLTPAFADAVGAVRRDCRIAVITGADDRRAYLGFHADRGGAGRPLGRKLADHQALVAQPGTVGDAQELVRACGLRNLAFDHLVAGDELFAPYVSAVEQASRVDLRLPGVEPPKEAALKLRRLERRHGVRFTWHDEDPLVLATLLRWKSEQYRRTGELDITRRRWVVELLERLVTAAPAPLAPVMSTLRDDQGTIVAVHLGLRSGAFLHSWFPAYDPELHKLSPGLALLALVIEHAPAEGVDIVDLGKGAEGYKARFANATAPVATAMVPAGRLGATTARAAAGGQALLLRTPLSARVNRLRRRIQIG